MAGPSSPVNRRGNGRGRLAPHGLKEATTDPEQVRKWWNHLPEANIGLPTGIRFDVLDVDGDDGFTSLARMVDEQGCLNSSPVAFTPNGGAHYYFLPSGCGNRTSLWRTDSHLDFRGEGGYVVAPPSIGTNGRYRWIVSPGDVPFETVPTWLLALLERPKAPPPPTIPSFGLKGTSYGRHALESECGRVALANEGTRNDTLCRAAFRLGQLVASRQLDLDDAWSNLLTRASELDSQRMRSDARSNPEWKPACSSQGGCRDRVHSEGVPSHLRSLVIPDVQNDYLVDPVDWPTFWLAEAPDTDWLIEPIVAHGRQTATASKAKSGKWFRARRECRSSDRTPGTRPTWP